VTLPVPAPYGIPAPCRLPCRHFAGTSLRRIPLISRIYRTLPAHAYALHNCDAYVRRTKHVYPAVRPLSCRYSACLALHFLCAHLWRSIPTALSSVTHGYNATAAICRERLHHPQRAATLWFPAGRAKRRITATPRWTRTRLYNCVHHSRQPALFTGHPLASSRAPSVPTYSPPWRDRHDCNIAPLCWTLLAMRSYSHAPHIAAAAAACVTIALAFATRVTAWIAAFFSLSRRSLPTILTALP